MILVGDFGGTMGLWLGASILAAAQLLDYLFMLCAATACNCSKERSSTVSTA